MVTEALVATSGEFLRQQASNGCVRRRVWGLLAGGREKSKRRGPGTSCALVIAIRSIVSFMIVRTTNQSRVALITVSHCL